MLYQSSTKDLQNIFIIWYLSVDIFVEDKMACCLVHNASWLEYVTVYVTFSSYEKNYYIHTICNYVTIPKLILTQQFLTKNQTYQKTKIENRRQKM